jgi:hypothetical protein
MVDCFVQMQACGLRNNSVEDAISKFSIETALPKSMIRLVAGNEELMSNQKNYLRYQMS